jgi:type I restriction enzyme S subunit
MTTELISRQEDKRELPDGWRWVTLEDVREVVSKVLHQPRLVMLSFQQEFPFYGLRILLVVHVNAKKVAFYIAPETHQLLSRSQLKPGDFLITIAGTLGRVGYVPHDTPPLNCNQAVAFARLKPNLIDSQFACFICQHDSIISPLLEQKAGGTIGNLNLEQVRRLKIPLPLYQIRSAL